MTSRMPRAVSKGSSWLRWMFSKRPRAALSLSVQSARMAGTFSSLASLQARRRRSPAISWYLRTPTLRTLMGCSSPFCKMLTARGPRSRYRQRRCAPARATASMASHRQHQHLAGLLFFDHVVSPSVCAAAAGRRAHQAYKKTCARCLSADKTRRRPVCAAFLHKKHSTGGASGPEKSFAAVRAEPRRFGRFTGAFLQFFPPFLGKRAESAIFFSGATRLRALPSGRAKARVSPARPPSRRSALADAASSSGASGPFMAMNTPPTRTSGRQYSHRTGSAATARAQATSKPFPPGFAGQPPRRAL